MISSSNKRRFMTSGTAFRFLRHILSYWWIFVSLLFCPGTIKAQIVPPGNKNPTGFKNDSSKFSGKFRIYEDAFDINNLRYFRYDFESPEDSFRIFVDSLEIDAQEYKPINLQAIPYLDLGRPGSPARPVVPASPFSRDFLETGVHAWDIYLYPAGKLYLYKQDKPLTVARVNQGFNGVNTDGTLQDNTLIKIDFSRRFAHNVQSVLHLNRILDRGFYKNDENRLMAFQTAFKLTPDSSKFQSALLYNFNELIRNEIGGVSDDSLIFDNQFYAKRLSLPVILTDANLRLTGFRLESFNRYYLTPRRKGLLLHDNLYYEREAFKFYDKQVEDSSAQLFYGNYLLDKRGMRSIWTAHKFGNELYAGLSGSKYLKYLHAGLRYRYERWNNDADRKDFHLLIPFAAAQFSYGKLLNSTHRIEASILHRKGLKWQNKLQLTLSKWGNLKLDLEGTIRAPSLQHEWIYISGKKYRDSTFSNLTSHRFAVHYILPGYGLNASVQAFWYHNYIYWDRDVQPVQVEAPVKLLSYSIQHQFHIWYIYLNNSIYYNASSDKEILLLPEWYSKHEIYAQHYFYNPLTLVRYGANVRYIRGGNLAPAYAPWLGQYHLPKQAPPYKAYYTTDLFFLLKVPQFDIYVRLDNATDLIQQRLYHNAEYWPATDWEFRMGLKWLLLN